MTIDLSGSGTTAQWATAVVAFLAFIVASLFAFRQIAIMKRQMDIIEWKNRRSDIVAHPKQLDPFHYAIEIHNQGYAHARNVNTLINGKPQSNASDIAPKDWITYSLNFLPEVAINVSISWTDDTGPRRYEKNAMYLA